MPFFASTERFGLSGGANVKVPAYYTNSSGYFMLQPSYSGTTLILTAANTTPSAIRTYSSVTAAWTIVHDKDLDSNVYYGMAESGTPKSLNRYVLAKGGTTISTSTINSYSGANSSVLGACYAPACMWSSVGYGAFIIGGFSQTVLHVLEFSADKLSITNSYIVPYTSEVYGTEVIPKAVSGFSKDYGAAYTRNSKQMSSWVVDMATRSWTNRIDNSYSGSPAQNINGSSMIYYPIGKPTYTGDPDVTQNRLAFTNTSDSQLYIWTITESTNQLVWAYLKTVQFFGSSSGGFYPYSMSTGAYNSIS